MITIFYTEEFDKRYNKLPAVIQRKAEKQEKIFRRNQWYPSLNTEKLTPKNKELWSFRIDRRSRILFRFLKENEIVFLTVGSHDWIYKIVSNW